MPQPDPAMLAGPEALARFIATGDPQCLTDVFSSGDVTIIENFAPYVFAGRDAVARWTAAMTTHIGPLTGMRHAFGTAQDVAVADDVAYFCLPTRWAGVAQGRSFTENGGWAFVLAREGGAWRVRAYAWSVVDYRFD